MADLALKPAHKSIKDYYEALARFEKLGVKHEGAVRYAFQNLLDVCAGKAGKVFLPAYQLVRKRAKPLEADGAIVDPLSKILRYGIWEAKDSDDDLEKEIKAKFAKGYPRDNILFQEPRQAILYQDGRRFFDANLRDPEQLIHALDLFFGWKPPAFDEWEKAVDEFKDRVPELGKGMAKLIRKERQVNAKYDAAFDEFLRICRASLNPNLSVAAVEEMLIQHILTERIFRKIFDIGDFMQRNVIAQEIEKVINALTSKSFSRDDFTDPLDHFYVAIEKAAETISDFSEKQKFLNTVYERFFQGFSVEVADTHGIVYTPPSLVNFMVESVETALAKSFNCSLATEDVQILDPFTGTGNFVVHLMQRIPPSALPKKYSNELWCNEVMLLPYYVASMNIEHALFEIVGKYEPFDGVCLVDTFEMAEREQRELFNEANTERVERQRKAPIKVIIANPPYNAGQVNENDNNKNRRYPEIERRIRNTYAADSAATLQRKLWDPYIKAIRFATDRIGQAGIVCYVNNHSFIAEKSFDGMRKHLAQDFDLIFVLDLGGNVRKNPKLSGTTHNVFGIQVGVSINLFIRLPRDDSAKRNCEIFYHAVPIDWRREQKYEFLDASTSIDGIKWRRLRPDSKHNWITHKTDNEFGAFISIGGKRGKRSVLIDIFRTYALGVSTNRDSVVYDFSPRKLADRVKLFAENYNAEVDRWISKAKPPKNPKLFSKYVDEFVDYDSVKWSETLKRHLVEEKKAKFDKNHIRPAIYRPFTAMSLYYAPLFVDRPSKFDEIFPTPQTCSENRVLTVNLSVERPFMCLMANSMPNLVFAGGFGSATFCFPRFTYSSDGKNRRENIPLPILVHFQNHYDDDSITRDDIFYYVYALLHHPTYRSRYAENLKRELPRIPLVGKAKTFHAFSDAGEQLAELHVNYEEQPEYKLKRIENRETKLDWRVEGMRLSKDRRGLSYNEHFAFEDIPADAFKYRLGNRSALEWVIDQYRVVRDEEDEIVSDPNRTDDEQYIIKLICRVITVSLRTNEIVAALPDISV